MHSDSGSRKPPSAKNLMEILDAKEGIVNKGHHENAERLRRAIGFIGRAEEVNFKDVKFVCYWMALNALYGDGDSAHKIKTRGELPLIKEFILKVFTLDKNDEIFKIMNDELEKKIHEILPLKEAFEEFWIAGYNHKVWEESEDGDISSRTSKAITHNVDKERWNEEFVKSNKMSDIRWEKARRMLDLKKITKKPQADMMQFSQTLFGRIYVVRNQLMHGCVSLKNDEIKIKSIQVGLDILRWLVPTFIRIILETKEKIDLGPIPYPFVGDGPFHPPLRQGQVIEQDASSADEKEGQIPDLFGKMP